MGYDLAFWCDPQPSERDAQAVYETLLDGREADGLGAFAVEATLAELAQRFPGMTHEAPGYAVWERGDDAAVIEFSWSAQHLVATARGTVSNDELNAIVDICVDVGGGRLYDPQTGERFDSV